MQAAMGLSDQQKGMALRRRELYWVELGRVLWHREKLLKQLQRTAVLMETGISSDHVCSSHTAPPTSQASLSWPHVVPML